MVATIKENNNTQPLNIFLIEDDDGDAKAVIRAFNKAKIANPIVRAYDGLEALEALRGENGHLALIFCCLTLTCHAWMAFSF